MPKDSVKTIRRGLHDSIDALQDLVSLVQKISDVMAKLVDGQSMLFKYLKTVSSAISFLFIYLIFRQLGDPILRFLNYVLDLYQQSSADGKLTAIIAVTGIFSGVIGYILRGKIKIDK